MNLKRIYGFKKALANSVSPNLQTKSYRDEVLESFNSDKRYVSVKPFTVILESNGEYKGIHGIELTNRKGCQEDLVISGDDKGQPSFRRLTDVGDLVNGINNIPKTPLHDVLNIDTPSYNVDTDAIDSDLAKDNNDRVQAQLIKMSDVNNINEVSPDIYREYLLKGTSVNLPKNQIVDHQVNIIEGEILVKANKMIIMRRIDAIQESDVILVPASGTMTKVYHEGNVLSNSLDKLVFESYKLPVLKETGISSNLLDSMTKGNKLTSTMLETFTTGDEIVNISRVNRRRMDKKTKAVLIKIATANMLIESNHSNIIKHGIDRSNISGVNVNNVETQYMLESINNTMLQYQHDIHNLVQQEVKISKKVTNNIVLIESVEEIDELLKAVVLIEAQSGKDLLEVKKNLHMRKDIIKTSGVSVFADMPTVDQDIILEGLAIMDEHTTTLENTIAQTKIIDATSIIESIGTNEYDPMEHVNYIDQMVQVHTDSLMPNVGPVLTTTCMNGVNSLVNIAAANPELSNHIVKVLNSVDVLLDKIAVSPHYTNDKTTLNMVEEMKERIPVMINRILSTSDVAVNPDISTNVADDIVLEGIMDDLAFYSRKMSKNVSKTFNKALNKIGGMNMDGLTSLLADLRNEKDDKIRQDAIDNKLFPALDKFLDVLTGLAVGGVLIVVLGPIIGIVAGAVAFIMSRNKTAKNYKRALKIFKDEEKIIDKKIELATMKNDDKAIIQLMRAKHKLETIRARHEEALDSLDEGVKVKVVK